MRVLHLPTETGGNAYGLANAEKKLGIDSRVLYRNQSWLSYPGDILIPPSKYKAIEAIRIIKTASKIYKEYDIYHFNFGCSLVDFTSLGLHHLDLPYIKNKKIVVTYNGCDARQKYKRMEQAELCACKYTDCYNGMCNDISVEKRKQKRIRDFESIGAHFFAVNPDLFNFLPTGCSFLPYSIARWDEIESKYDPNRYDKLSKIRIVHAPTNRVAKGSDLIIDAVNRLKIKYPDRLELVLVENLTHNDALKVYSSADIVIDQIRIGWYGAFAVEAMKMGKPVIAYINENDLKYLPNSMGRECKEALISANDIDIYEVLEKTVNDIQFLKRKNEAQLEYVNKWHNPLYVASITKNIYEKL